MHGRSRGRYLVSARTGAVAAGGPSPPPCVLIVRASQPGTPQLLRRVRPAFESLAPLKPLSLTLSPAGRGELLQWMRLRRPDAAGQWGCQRHQRGEQPQPPPDRPLLAAQQLVPAETAVAVERAGDAPTVAALVQLQAAMPTAHLIGMVQHHGRLVAARA